MEHRISIGKAVVRGSVRNIRRTAHKHSPVIQVKSYYRTTSERHDYNQQEARTLRKTVQGERMLQHDAVGGTRLQRRIIKSEGATDRIRRKVDQAAYKKVKRHLTVRVNGKELGKRVEEQGRTVARIGIAQIRNAYHNTGNAALSGSEMSSEEKAAQNTSQAFERAASITSAGVAHIHKTAGTNRTSEKIEKLKQQIHSTDKKIYQTDRKLGKAIVKSKKSTGRLLKDRQEAAGPAGSLRGGISGSPKGGLRQTMRTNVFLRNDKRVLQIAQQKSMFMQQRQGNIRKLHDLQRKSITRDLFLRRILFSTGGVAAFFLVVILGLLYAGSLLSGSEEDRLVVSLNDDAGIVASFLYENKDELWDQDGNDFVRISGVLGALTVNCSGFATNGTIQHDRMTTEKPDGRKSAKSSTGYQGLCSWTNEEIDEYITKRKEAGYHAEKNENGVADLYTQLYLLKEKLLEMKENQTWNDYNLNPEQAAGLCYAYLILRETNLAWDNKWVSNFNDNGILPHWALIYGCAYFSELGEYDYYAQNHPDASWDDKSSRYHICYPLDSMSSPGKKGVYICHFQVPHRILTSKLDEEGNPKEVSTSMSFACHWVLSSKVYEICYLLDKDGYRISETSTGYIDDPQHPTSLYSLGLALVINQAENTKGINGEYCESNWGSVIDEGMAKYFMERDFIWGGSDTVPGTEPIWEFRAIS